MVRRGLMTLLAVMALCASANADSVDDWKAALSARIRAGTSYPELARLMRSEGVVLIGFTVDRAGAVHNVRIVRSSGSLLLDGRTVRVIYAAQPLPPPPAFLAGANFRFVLPIRYSLTGENTSR